MSKIDDVLSAELHEVKISSEHFTAAVESHNYLPDEFPTHQIRMLTVSLGGLSEGSLEGARIPLEHANVRLSEMRRRFFSHRGSDSEEEDAFDVPTLERGDALDSSLISLLSSISTALDAYREQARSELESTNTSDFLDIIPGINTESQENIGIESQIAAFDELQQQANEDRNSSNSAIELVAVSAADARNSLASAEAEASSSYVIRGWIRKLTRLSADSLMLLRKSIDGLSVAGGVAYTFYKKYKSSVSNIRDSVIKEAQDWLSFISEQLQRAESVLREESQSTEDVSFGIVRSIATQKFIVTADDIPFAISPMEKDLPKIGSIVQFEKEFSDEKILAKRIILSKSHLIINKELVPAHKAKEPLEKLVSEAIKRSMKTSVPVG